MIRKANQLILVDALPGVLPRLLGALRRRMPVNALGALGAAASLVLLAFAAVVLLNAFSNLRLAEVGAALSNAAIGRIIAAAALTAVSYLALTGYDFAALRLIGARASPSATMLGAFASYAVSFTLGFPLVTGPAVRYWIYAREGLDAAAILKITVVTGVTFWLGMVAALGAGAVVGADALGMVDHLPAFVHALAGAALIGGLCVYCVWTARAPRRIRLRGHLFDLPGPQSALAQIALGAVDVCCAGAALYVLFPDHALGLPAFLAVYVFACLLGVVSHAPGGIGVFEATMLHAAPAAAPESAVAALLLFRLIYYIAPFALALLLLWADNARRQRS